MSAILRTSSFQGCLRTLLDESYSASNINEAADSLHSRFEKLMARKSTWPIADLAEDMRARNARIQMIRDALQRDIEVGRCTLNPDWEDDSWYDAEESPGSSFGNRRHFALFKRNQRKLSAAFALRDNQKPWSTARVFLH